MRFLFLALLIVSALAKAGPVVHSLQGNGYVDITAAQPGLWLELPRSANPNCRLEFRSNQLAATEREFAELAKRLVVAEEKYIGMPVLIGQVSRDALSYPLGQNATLLRVRTADGKSLHENILRTFIKTLHPSPTIPHIIAYRAQCD